MGTAVGVAVAGAFGALARYAVDVRMGQRGFFPWDTFIVNITGAFLLGLLFALFVERGMLSPWLRTTLTVGLIGGYTTFSTLSYETLRLIEGGSYGLAAVNALGSLAAGIVAVFIGMTLGRAI
jgi:fluoride exporter